MAEVACLGVSARFSPILSRFFASSIGSWVSEPLVASSLDLCLVVCFSAGFPFLCFFLAAGDFFSAEALGSRLRVLENDTIYNENPSVYPDRAFYDLRNSKPVE